MTTVICLSFKPELTFDQGPGYAVCSLNKKMATSHALPVGVEHSSKSAAMQQNIVSRLDRRTSKKFENKFSSPLMEYEALEAVEFAYKVLRIIETNP